MRASAVLLWALSLTGAACAGGAGRPPSRGEGPPPLVVDAPAPAEPGPAVSEQGAKTGSAEKQPAPQPPPDTRPRIGSVRWLTYIWSTPDRPKNHLPIGSVRFGTSLALRSPDPVPGDNCLGRWYAVEPAGYICEDETTTFDFDSPYWKALASVVPGPGPWPYQYAFSTGAPMYSRIPTPEEQRRAEWGMGPVRTFKPLGKWSEGHERLVSTDPADVIEPTSEVPEFFRDHRSIPGSPYNASALPRVRTIPAGSGLAYARAFSAAGRTWLLTPELLLVPADRVFRYKRQSFKGVALGSDVDLPLAWIRGASQKKLSRDDGGAFRETGDTWGAKAAVPLTGREAAAGKRTYYETREAGIWIEGAAGVSVARAVTELPRSIGPNEKWIEARILPGTMVAYVGLRPVWATLWSPGKGGVPVKGNDPKRFATTETGTFAFQWKDKVATMSPDKGAATVFWFSDVPNIQYVHAPLALHVAYWHEDFGAPMSAECLNVSAPDGEWLFDFTLPVLPKGWNSVRPSKAMGPATKIVIRGQ